MVIQTGSSIADQHLILSEYEWILNGSSAEMKTVQITSGSDWFVASYPEWIVPSVMSGTKADKTISFYCSSNDDMNARNDYIQISNERTNAKITVWQPGSDAYASVLNVILPEGDIKTGETINIRVYTKNADSVQLLVDGKAYDTADVYNGQATICRSFSQGGKRRISILPFRNGVAGITSAEQYILIKDNGKLGQATFSNGDQCFVATTIKLDWTDIDFAEKYLIYLSDGTSYRKLGEANVSEYDLDGSYIPQEGTYTIDVIAIATGYSQSTSTLTLTAVTPQKNFTIGLKNASLGFETHDEIGFDITNPSGYPVKVRVQKNDDSMEPVYLPETGDFTLTSGKITYVPLTDGTYMAELVAYASVPVIDKTAYWGIAAKSVTFKVTAGVIDQILVGGEEENARKDKTDRIFVKTTKTVEKLEIYIDNENTPSKTILASDSTQCIQDTATTRLHFNGTIKSVEEGAHTYKVVSTNVDGAKNTVTKTIYVYTPDDQKLVRYPKSGTVYLLKNPITSGTADRKLALSDKLTILGTYGNLYYAETVHNKKYIKGYVQKNLTAETEQIDWNAYTLTVVSWPDSSPAKQDLLDGYVDYAVQLTKDYEISVSWDITPDIPPYAGFRVLLEPTAEAVQWGWKTIDLTDSRGYVTGATTLTFKASELAAGCKDQYNANSGDYKLKIEIVDTRNDQTQKTAISKGYRTLGTSAVTNQAFEYYNVQFRYAKSAHEATMDILELKNMSSVYAFVTGKWDDMHLTFLSRGALIADQIMEKLAKNKVKDGVSVSEIKQIMSLAKFDLEIIQQFEEKAEELARARYWSSRQTSWVFQLDREEDDKYFEELEKATINKGTTEGYLEIMSGITKVMDVVDTFKSLIKSYYTYRSVSADDVKGYIDVFRSSGDETLRFAADCLEAMTYNDACLIAYLGAEWGFNHLASAAEGRAYDAIVGALPVSWKFAIQGASLVNDLFLNTSSTIKVALDYAVVYETMGQYVQEMEKVKTQFANDPVKYYELLKSKQDVFLMTLKLELGYLEELCKSINESNWQKFWNFIDEKNEIKFEGEESYKTFETSLNDALQKCYAISVGPFTE